MYVYVYVNVYANVNKLINQQTQQKQHIYIYIANQQLVLYVKV